MGDARIDATSPGLVGGGEVLSRSRAPFVSVRVCIAVSVAAGLLGLVLMRVIPVGIDHEYLDRYAIWAREVSEMFEACGKHEPRDPECVRQHPIRQRP
jgi:hypothetical protein